MGARRAAAMHVLCALGSFAIGSALWGALASVFGLAFTLLVAAAGMIAGALLAIPFPLRMGDRAGMATADAWEEIAVLDEPPPAAGPVAVEFVYRIRPEDAGAFLRAAEQLRTPGGATARFSGAYTATSTTRPATSSASSSPRGPTTCASAGAPWSPTASSRRASALSRSRACRSDASIIWPSASPRSRGKDAQTPATGSASRGLQAGASNPRHGMATTCFN